MSQTRPSPFRPSLVVGLEGVLPFTVEMKHCINRFNIPGAEVLSSPQMINEMEWACCMCEDPPTHFLPGYNSVGMTFEIKHLAAARLGDACVAKARILEISGNKLNFEVEVRCGDKLIGQGTHKRAVIQMPTPPPK